MAANRFLRSSIVAALLAGSIGAYAQTGSPQTDAILAARRAEWKRYQAANSKIQDERIDAQAQLRIDLNHCTGSNAQAYQKCSEEANNRYREAMRKINDEQIKEDALHQKNDNAIDRQSDMQCTRPDCVNSSNNQKTNCHGSCAP